MKLLAGAIVLLATAIVFAAVLFRLSDPELPQFALIAAAIGAILGGVLIVRGWIDEKLK
jgi:cytochrome bd-type quinol oxidase subunit 1